MSLDIQAITYAATQTSINVRQVAATCKLLIEDQCTVPFISRYRKEVTGSLDEVQIRQIHEHYEEYLKIEQRRTFILETIEKMEKMTPELKNKILSAQTVNQLEDIYAPFKVKKKTKGMIAQENGLAPFAHFLLTSFDSMESQKAELEKRFVTENEKVATFQEAFEGACHILLENFSGDPEMKESMRKEYWNSAIISSEKRKEAEKEAEFLKFKDFFEFSEPVRQIKEAKNTHRFLALRRGMTLNILKVTVAIDTNAAYQIMQNHFFAQGTKLGNYPLLKKISEKAFDNHVALSMDLEIKTELKKIADDAAISVFGVNLKNLLLQPYLGAKSVLGIDPGIRTGCKIVIIDQTGKYIADHVIYPFAPKFDVEGSRVIIEKIIELFNIEYIAIGNGTNGRETLEFVQDNIKQVKEEKVKAVLVNESGASIYSASDIAREEFPDKDVTVRGSISIARRFQDPLAELVKIDPKSIGVGQYQHDINQVKLKKSLEGVVEDCVNFVGVDINTASAPLLSFISGIGPSVAKKIVETREKNGGFKKREDLLTISRFSQKIFEQSAGFLRIYNGENLLDSTFIHPENYPILEEWTKQNNISVSDLIESKEVITKLERDNSLKEKIGAVTLSDIVKALKSPKQDPREEFIPVDFNKNVRTMNDLKINQWYVGVVNNITNFGAFVDLGIKESGLLHVSQISDEFISDPMEKLKVGEQLKVRVIEIDVDRKRVSLSCKSTDKTLNTGASTSSTSGGNKKNHSYGQQTEIKNNAFAKLAGLKLK